VQELLVAEAPARLPSPPPAGTPPVRAWPDFRLGYALLVPVLLVCLAPTGFLYDPLGYLDSNIYVGYFLHYTEHLPVFENYYKVSRLPWVLPGFAAYRAFGPVAAHYVLTVGSMAFALACLYLALRDIFDAGTALFGVALLGTCQWLHGVGGWNYHMTITIAYYLLTVLCLGRAARGSRPRCWYFLAGAALSLVVHTHLYMVVFVPGLVLHSWLTCRAADRKLSLLDALAALAGGLAATALLGIVNRATGGQFLFFMPQIDYVRRLSEQGNRWHQPLMSWLPGASWLVLPAAALLTCPLLWLSARRGLLERNRPQTLVIAGFQGQLVLATLAGCYYQFVKHQTVLDTGYQAIALLGPAILVLCGFVHTLRDRCARLGPHGLFAIALALLAVPFLVAQHRGAVPQWIAPIVLPGLLAAAGIAALAVARRSAWALAAGVALLGLSNAFIDYGWARAAFRDTFLFSIEADRFATRLDPTLTDIKYWYDTQEVVETSAGPLLTQGCFDNFVSTRMWNGNLLGGVPVPAIAEIQARHVTYFTRVAVLSTTTHKEDYCRRLTERFADLGMPLRREAEQEFRHEPLNLSIVVFRIQKPGSL